MVAHDFTYPLGHIVTGSFWHNLDENSLHQMCIRDRATSGLIVHPDFRGLGLAKRIKQASFQLARLRWRKQKYSV